MIDDCPPAVSSTFSASASVASSGDCDREEGGGRGDGCIASHSARAARSFAERVAAAFADASASASVARQCATCFLKTACAAFALEIKSFHFDFDTPLCGGGDRRCDRAPVGDFRRCGGEVGLGRRARRDVDGDTSDRRDVDGDPMVRLEEIRGMRDGESPTAREVGMVVLR